MTYTELTKAAEDRISSVPMFFAFSNQQFDEGCKKLGVTNPKEELISTGFGGYIRKTDRALLDEAIKENERERVEFLSDMKNLQYAFEYELSNHEYCITYDDTEAWEALGLDLESSTQEQRQAYVTAREHYLAGIAW